MMNLWALAEEGAAHHEHEAPHTIFTPVWESIKDTYPGQWMGFNDEKLGAFWFDAIGFSLLAALILITCSWLATRRYEKVPRGLQNLMEWIVGLLRNFIHGIIGESGDKYLPYLGTVFLFIFVMNLLGLIPAFRSPTMTLSTTAALGITTIIMVQAYAIRATGVVGYLRHFMGPVLWLAWLMVPLEIISEMARPMSLSLRLYGNIFGEDNVMEALMKMGGWFPAHLPILILAVLTCFVQAFVFMCLTTIYIGTKIAHDDSHGEESHAH